MTMNVEEKFGKRVRALRMQRKWSQEEAFFLLWCIKKLYL